MELQLGVKSDPVEYRYSYPWLFSLMRELDIPNLQLGSFFELYSLPDDYFLELRETAAAYGVRIRSVFTAHRELGGFFAADYRFEALARAKYERLIQVAALLGADYAGSNPGAVYRDRLDSKPAGLERYRSHMQELSFLAKELGLRGLTVEPMSCLAEPPSTPAEIDALMGSLRSHHAEHPDATVPVFLCGDVSHGVADASGRVVHGNMELFEHGIPWMCEFHFKNTDARFGSTFGFGSEERRKGIVDVDNVVETAYRRAEDWPVSEVVGYLEIGGPKLGRDYSDHLLEEQLRSSLLYLRERLLVPTA